jgi:DNA-binding NarL/FixJ family response regulator
MRFIMDGELFEPTRELVLSRRRTTKQLRAVKARLTTPDQAYAEPIVTVDGIEATRRLVVARPDIKILILTTFHDDEYVYGALRAGASGFLLKRASPERLLEAVRTVAAGEALLDPLVTRGLIHRFLSTGGPTAPRPSAETRRQLDRLTERERQVLVLVAQGRSNAEIADLLFIAESTAKTHVKRVLSKIDVHDRAQAVVFAYRSGLLTNGTINQA